MNNHLPTDFEEEESDFEEEFIRKGDVDNVYVDTEQLSDDSGDDDFEVDLQDQSGKRIYVIISRPSGAHERQEKPPGRSSLFLQFSTIPR